MYIRTHAYMFHHFSSNTHVVFCWLSQKVAKNKNKDNKREWREIILMASRRRQN